jgi:hypothetical protein
VLSKKLHLCNSDKTDASSYIPQNKTLASRRKLIPQCTQSRAWWHCLCMSAFWWWQTDLPLFDNIWAPCVQRQIFSGMFSAPKRRMGVQSPRGLGVTAWGWGIPFNPDLCAASGHHVGDRITGNQMGHLAPLCSELHIFPLVPLAFLPFS